MPETTETPEIAATPAPNSTRSRFAALRSRNFVILWSGGLVSNMGSQMQSVATAWLILQLTNSALSLGLLSLCFAAPITFFPPIGGLLADRMDRILILKCARVIQIVQPLLIALLLATGHIQLWMLYAHLFLIGTVSAFSAPANQALVPALVTKDELLSAASLQSVIWTGATLIGPALGGLLLLPLGVAGLYTVDGLSTIAVFVPLFLIRGVQSREVAAVGMPRRRLSDGLRYVWQHRPVFVLLCILTCISVLDGGYGTLLPILARDQWHVGANGYGVLRSAPGAGALLGGFMMAALGDIQRKEALAIGATLFLAAALVAIVHVPLYALALVLAFLVGLASTIAAALIQTQLQITAPGNLRGSIMSLYIIAWIGIDAFGGLLGGSLAQFFGAVATVTGTAIVGFAVTLLLTLLLSKRDP